MSIFLLGAMLKLFKLLLWNGKWQQKSKTWLNVYSSISTVTLQSFSCLFPVFGDSCKILQEYQLFRDFYYKNDRAQDTTWISAERTSMIIAESLPKRQIRQNLQPNSILFNFLCIPLRFDGQKHKFLQFFLCFVAHVSTGMTIRCVFWKNSRFWPPTVWFIFTPMG